MKKSLKEMQERFHAGIPQEAEAIVQKAEEEKRELTDDEVTKLEALRAEQESLAKEIEAEQRRQRAAAHFAARPAAPPASAPAAPVVAPTSRVEVVERRRGPFASLGEQLLAVVAASSGVIDPRLHQVAEASGASSAQGADGGFLIQSDFTTDLMSRGMAGGEILRRCDPHTVSEGSDSLEVVYPDDLDRSTGMVWGGVRMYRRAEADTVNPTKPKLEKWECRLEDLMGIAYATDRLIRDAAAMEGVFRSAFSEGFVFKVEGEIVDGSGAGECLGILKSGALITVAKGSGQAADTVIAENITTMWAALPMRNRANAVWLINFEVEQQLPLMTIGNQPVYIPPGGLNGSPYGLLLSRPVIVCEHCTELGEVGDVILADLSQYKLISKRGLREDTSIHVRFIHAEKTFRWMAAINGAPKWKTPYTPAKARAGKKLSPFVTLAQRT